MVLVGNDNDKNAGCFGGNGVEGVFRRSSDISPTKVASGNGGTEQWRGSHHRRLRRSRPLIVLRKERDRAQTMTALRIGDVPIDEHIAKYKMLVTKAKLKEENPVVIDLFRETLSLSLQR